MTTAAVSIVAVVAAIASYVHIHTLAVEAGEEWRAILIPLSVDGMLVAASMVMLVRRRAGERAGALPWIGLILGLVASLAANVAAADPTVLSWVVSGWPPLALAVSFELLIRVTREPGPVVEAGSEPAEIDADALADPDPGEWWVDAPAAGELVGDTTRAAELVRSGMGRRKLAKTLNVSEHEARQLLERHREVAS
ncbi:DUF2637 domain-containing protein [Pseudonocardia ailaonensis]|uniref:DUF2637 domain-containing protein n=1 Tax=Pseudonocardia ailaonensis TaxID=367279 RepID=UPI0031D96909